MKVDGKEFQLDYIQPRTTTDGLNYVALVGYQGLEAECTRTVVKLTSDELTAITNKLAKLSTISGKY